MEGRRRSEPVGHLQRSNPIGPQEPNQALKYSHASGCGDVLKSDQRVDEVEPSCRGRELVVAPDKFNVRQSPIMSVLSCGLQHRTRHIHTDHRVASLRKRDQEAANTTPKVEGSGRSEVRFELSIDYGEQRLDVVLAGGKELSPQLRRQVLGSERLPSENPEVWICSAVELPRFISPSLTHSGPVDLERQRCAESRE